MTRIVMCALIFISALHPSASFAVLDNFNRNEDGTMTRRIPKPMEQTYDPSCISRQDNNILHLPHDKLIRVFESKILETKVDVYLCSCQAGAKEERAILFEYLCRILPHNIEYFLQRLDNEHSDLSIMCILYVFGTVGIEDTLKKLSATGEYPATEELYFKAKTARYLVSKAEEIKDEGTREMVLGLVIPLLPPDEAMARQAQREEARKKSQK